MALSKRTKDILTVALADKKASTEISAAADVVGARISAFVAANTAPAATDLVTTEVLANANKATINALLAALVAAGLMKSS